MSSIWLIWAISHLTSLVGAIVGGAIGGFVGAHVTLRHIRSPRPRSRVSQ